MLQVFKDTPGLRQALAALPSEAKHGLRLKRHPWDGELRLVRIHARTWTAERTLIELERHHPTATWSRGAWAINRVQLALFREGSA
jgi:hypothetical protein